MNLRSSEQNSHMRSNSGYQFGLVAVSEETRFQAGLSRDKR